jgi:hypothetical protein
LPLTSRATSGVLERHPQLLLLPDLPAASAAAAEALAALSPRAAAAPAETAAAARAAVATAPYLSLRLAAEHASGGPEGAAAAGGEPQPLPVCWEDLPMEVHNLMANEWDEWDDYDEKRAAYNKEWAGR